MITAVIDIGTNTFNLLIQDQDKKLIYNDKIPVKLGKGGIDQNLISAEAFQRGIHALERYRDICKIKSVNQVFAFATSAVRSASNGPAFVEEALEQCGININVIDGDREALLIYEGVTQAVPLAQEADMIVDIGGGSTEIVIANKEGVLWEGSYPLGVSRILETCKPGDPLSSEDIEKINAHFDETLVELPAQIRKHKPRRMIGSSGSFETLHDVCAERFNHPTSNTFQKSARIYLHELNLISEQLLTSKMTERLVMPGMLAMRADTIHISALQIKYLLGVSKIKELQLSLYALKEGVMASLNKPHEPWQTSSL
jgi:exopolyphosphatase/guanosine-5'-triphosphate,3'-diphosphate pyrophosphatase